MDSRTNVNVSTLASRLDTDETTRINFRTIERSSFPKDRNFFLLDAPFSNIPKHDDVSSKDLNYKKHESSKNEGRNTFGTDLSCFKQQHQEQQQQQQYQQQQLIVSGLSSILVFRGIQDGCRFRSRRRCRDWRRHIARCTFRISNRGGGRRLLRGRCGRYTSRKRGPCDAVRFSSPRTGHPPRHARKSGPVVDEPRGKAGPLSSSARNTRKRRVGIVENHYVAESDGAPSTLCELVRGLERLLDDRASGPGNGVTMKSKKQQYHPQQQQRKDKQREEEEEEGEEEDEEEEEEIIEEQTVETSCSKEETPQIVDPCEANETYDEFDTVRMPVVRALSKSPQSDEGIESDPERRRGSVARCWSLDSTAASDDDTSLNTHQQKRHKLRVTRCCSSDSAVLSDEDQIKGWDNSNMVEGGGETEQSEGRPRYWRTPSVVVSDYSDYSYLDEKLERSDLDLEKYDGTSGTPSQASSCSCLDCDEIRESLDNQFLRVCRHRRHSDSCCLCLDPTNAAAIRNFNETGNRRNSCLDSTGPYYSKFDSQLLRYARDNASELQEKGKVELLNIPPARKISDCSTNSSLSGDECEVTELQQVKPSRSSGWRKLRNIVHWTPFFQTYKKQRYPWVQLGGHQGNFRAGPTPGTILKKLCPQEEACFRLLMNDVLRPYVPEFKGVLDVRETEEGNAEEADARETLQKDETDDPANKRTVVSSYLQLQDLLGDFEHPCVMDCKVGVRTYLESELAKAKERPKLRKDMYEKMVQVDPTAPSAEERRVQGVTKPRYMVWRETISSTATLGFRVEGIKLAHGGSSKDFKTTRTREQVTEALRRFVEGYPHAVPKYLQRLKAIRATLKASPFFASHEVVGSSLLFVHDSKNAGIWMIDFAKTLPLPQHLPRIRHDAEWQVGNHEDGYLIGVNNLIDIFQDIRNSEA